MLLRPFLSRFPRITALRGRSSAQATMRSLISWAVALTVSACDQPQIKVRRVVEPAQRTLSQLLVRYDTASFPACRFPGPSGHPQQSIVSHDSALRLPVGGEWKPVAVDRELPDSAMKWRRAGGGAVTLRRVLNGASGPSWLVTPFHVLVAHPTCMLRRGETGAIWRLYDSPDSTGTDAGRSYDALAEVITRDSLRYQVSIQAPSAALRDSLAGEVSRAIIGST